MSRPFFLSCEIWGFANKASEIVRDICIRIDEKMFEIAPFAEGIESIAIIVNCHPESNMLAGWGKPRKYINYQKGYADIRLPIPYVEFMSADYEDQYRMVVKNIVESLRVIGDKCKKSKKAKLDADALIKVFLEKLNLSKDEIKDVKGVVSDEEYRKLMAGML